LLAINILILNFGADKLPHVLGNSPRFYVFREREKWKVIILNITIHVSRCFYDKTAWKLLKPENISLIFFFKKREIYYTDSI